MELDIIRAIQTIHTPFLTFITECITMLGEPVFVVLVFAFIYWCVDKEKGRFVAFSILLSLCINGALKDIFKLPRPIGEEGIISHRVHTATGHSFPSGHTQSVSSLMFSAAFAFKKRFLWILGTVMTVLVAFSRVYLGVHYPKDVLVGAVLGFFIPFICEKLYNRIKNKNLLHITACAIFIPFFFFINLSDDFIKSFALFLGFSFGAYLDDRFFKFKQSEEKSSKYISFLFGAVMIGLLAGILSAVLPEHIAFSFLKYMLISFLGIGVFPTLSVKACLLFKKAFKKQK